MTSLRRISLRARLAALTLIPLIGLGIAAHTWASDRQQEANRAEAQEEATHVVVQLAELQLSVKIDEKVMTGLGGTSAKGTVALVASQALDGIHRYRDELAAKEADLDALAGRDGAWREVASAVDALLKVRDAQTPAGRGAASFETLVTTLGENGRQDVVSAFAKAIRHQDGAPSAESAAAAKALHKLMNEIAAASPDQRATLVLLSRAASLEETIVDQAFLSLSLLAGRPVDATTAPALAVLESRQRTYVEVSRMLIPPTQARLLEGLTSSRAVVTWHTLTTFLQQYAQTKPADRPALPPIKQGGAAALDVTTMLIRYRAELAAALARAAATHADEARSEANTAIAAAAAVIVLTLLMAISIAVSIRRPLKRLEQRAHRLSVGELETDEKRKSAPKEIEIVSSAFDELASTLSVIGAQATAFSTGDVDNPILQQEVEGELGKAMRDSSKRLSAIGADLRASEELSRAIVTNAADAIWTIDGAGTIVTANPAATKLLGCGTHWIGRSANELLGREIASDDEVPDLSNEEIWLRKPDGSRIPALVSTSKAADIWTVFARDISELKEYEARLSHQAFHDELTGLPNRALLLDRIEHALARAGRDDDWAVALLMIDLDDFKQVNDALGHTAGDELLTNAAKRIESCLRPGDTAARLGGDEFAVLLEDNVDTGGAVAVARRITEVLQLPLTAGDRDLAATASVGLTIATTDSTPHTLLRDADTAMYAAKTTGKGRVETFTPSMHEDATRRLSLRNDLAVALDHDELRLLFQPLIELSSREIVGAEALLRWHHPTLGIVAPLDFIPVAEESGLIVPIGRWVLRESCIAAAGWPTTGRRTAVNVNLSGAQLANDDVVEAVREALTVSGLEPGRLVLELTESVLLDDVDNVTTVLTGLKELGVSIAIDDFGTGYCSLAYLKKFPVDHLKIDRSFIEDLTHVNGDRSLARSIVDLAGVLGLSAVAEGVETAEQADLLQALACDFAQGYHFSRPIELDKLTELITAGTSELVSG